MASTEKSTQIKKSVLILHFMRKFEEDRSKKFKKVRKL